MSNGGAQFQFFQFVDDTGTPYASSKLYHYAAGTTTDKDIWTDEAKTTPAAQPIVADSKGIITFYADGDYKFVLKDSSDNTLYTWDNVRITSDSATMWEGNHGTAYPSAAAANIWQLFAKHTAGNVLQELGINNGSSFVPLVGIDSNLKYAVDTGAADAYLIAPNPPITAYTAGQIFYMKATNANTGASTVNVNNLGIKSITKDGADALIANDILAGQIIALQYDGTNFQLMSPSGESVYEDATQTLTNKTLTTPTITGNWGGGVMTSGTIRLDRLKRIEVSNENAGAITVTSALTTVTTIDLGTVVTGDRVMITAYMVATKGGTLGDVTLRTIYDSGTGLIEVYHDALNLINRQHDVPAAKSIVMNLSGIIKINTGGTLILKLAAESVGSDSTVGIGSGQLYALVLNNG